MVWAALLRALSGEFIDNLPSIAFIVRAARRSWPLR
jgi:hypothetical protein